VVHRNTRGERQAGEVTPACPVGPVLLQPPRHGGGRRRRGRAPDDRPGKDAMKNFLRSLRCSLPYRYRLFFSIICALLAAGFWSVNFLAIHPILKLLGGESLVGSVDRDIEKVQRDELGLNQARLKNAQAQLEELNRLMEVCRDDKARQEYERKERDLNGQVAQLQSRCDTASTKIYRLSELRGLYQRFLPAEAFGALTCLIGLVALTVLVKGFFEFLQESLSGSVVNLTLYDLRNRFYRHTLHLDVNQFNDAGSAELMARFTNDMELLGVGLKMLYGKMVAEPLKALGCVVIACAISWQLTFLFLVLVPAVLFLLVKVSRMMKRASRRVLERMSAIYKILQETFQGIRVVKAYTMEPYERRRFRVATREYYRKSMQVVNLDAASGPVIELLGVAAVSAAILAGAYLVLNKETHLFGLRMLAQPMDHETLLMFYGLLAAVADPVRKLSSVYTKLQSGAAASDRIYAILDRRPRVTGPAGAARLHPHRGSVEFRNVCYSYEPGKPALDGINLRVAFGETVALVGHNGCGKTTLLSLLPRFDDPTHGSVLIDGVDLRTIDLRGLRQQLGLVTQETVLFDDTVFANIAYGNRRARLEGVEAAARRAFAHDFISRLPEGYATRVGERGAKLSGGERQKIGLARAILRDPRVLVLDEFTSQIDPESESDIHEALRTFLKGRTTFLITHRLHTLEIADRIVVMDRGRIEAVGTHAELLRSSPAYQRLCEGYSQRRVA
jgi:ATP-binding cassette subfamily B protein/subfamily B ATP-binding cassette protein MsbA